MPILSNFQSGGNIPIDATPTSGSSNAVSSGGTYTALAGKAPKTHSHTKSEISDFPAAIKNPNSLNVGDKNYDGSEEVTINKSDIGLGNVENKSSATIRGELTSSNVTSALGFTPAKLDSSGKVLTSQLPSYVDDVLEYSAKSSFPAAGETGKIYVDTSTNKTYRWSGSAYVEISASLALGETASTAYYGDKGKVAYNHSQAAHAPSDAEKNQNAFSSVKVGGTTISADTTTDTLTLVAGDNVTITPDATGDKITISASDTHAVSSVNGKTGAVSLTPTDIGAAASSHGTHVTAATVKSALGTGSGTTKYLREDGSWAVPPDTNTTYSDATQSTHGLMSTTDKKKLDGIATGANAYTHPTSSGNKHIPSGGSSGQILRWSSDGTAVWGADNNTTYSAATTTSAGLMSASDKSKLDGIATGANKITVDTALSSTSTNPVQNKVINSALAGKAASSHTHTKSQIADFPTSMPASDVPAWAKAASKPTYTASEVGAVSKTGGDTMASPLTVQSSGDPYFNLHNTSTNRYFNSFLYNGTTGYITNRASNDDYNGIEIQPETGDVTSGLRLIRKTGGTTSYYKLYGEHNKPAPADIGALSTGGGTVTGAVHLNGGTYLDASTYMKNGVFYNAYDSSGTACCLLGLSGNTLYLGSMSTYPHSGSTYISSSEGTVALRCGGNAINFAVGGDSPTGSTYRRLTWNTYGESVAYLTCAANGISHLGSSSNKWKNVYATTGTIQTSDRNAKKNIEDMDDRYIQLFDLVRPVTYQLLVGDRIHTGFISQEVEEAMGKVGLTAEELGFFCKDIQVEIVEDEDGKEYQKEVLDENGNPVYIYSLRYEEYIAIMAEKIRRLEAKYNEKLEQLEARLVKLENK